MGQPGVPRGAVFHHLEGERGDDAFARLGDRRAVASIDDAFRELPAEVDQAPAGGGFDQFGRPLAHALQRDHRPEQGKQDVGAHRLPSAAAQFEATISAACRPDG